LALAWGGALAGRLRSNPRHTYGWKRASILAAFFNALLLLVAMGSLGWEAVGRLGQPTPAQGGTIMGVAAIGIAINSVTALLFMKGSEHDLNIRGAFMHMAADALVSVGVVAAGALSVWKGWSWIDPVVSLIIVVVILVGTWGLFRQSLHLLFDGVPFDIDPVAVRAYLASQPGVSEVHDLHIWAMGTTQSALMAHLVMPVDGGDDAFLQRVTAELHERFEICHVTLQVERAAFCQPCDASCTPDSSHSTNALANRS
jgi:cobalt-zinc-cadmium efflux system protein